ncbi:MAG TPA: hypothetical protein VE132_01335 [Micromonosporaceae bacterium]|nr:hypothetical protein [Micromonosporaceae bacterium]
MHIEFTQFPDANRERRHMRLLFAHQFRGRRVLMIVLAILMVLLGAVLIAAGAAVFGVALLAFGALYPLLVVVSFRRTGDRFVRRFAKVHSVPIRVTITDTDVAFTSPFQHVAWAWSAIDTVIDLGELVLGKCGEAPVLSIPLTVMSPAQAAELRAFLAGRPTMASPVVPGEIRSARPEQV